jgi:hypothetical protein
VECREKGFLDQVFRILAVMNHAHGQAGRTRNMAVDQEAERRFVTCLHLLEKSRFRNRRWNRGRFRRGPPLYLDYLQLSQCPDGPGSILPYAMLTVAQYRYTAEGTKTLGRRMCSVCWLPRCCTAVASRIYCEGCSHSGRSLMRRILALAVGLCACADSTAPPQPGAASITDLPDSLVFHTIARSQQLEPRVLDMDNHTVETSVAFVIADPGVATAASDGTVIPLSAGRTTVTVSAGGVSRAVRVIVDPVPASIYPGVPSIILFGTEFLPFRPVVLDSLGHVIEGPPVEISIADSSVAEVSGLSIRAKTAGSTIAYFRSGPAVSAYPAASRVSSTTGTGYRAAILGPQTIALDSVVVVQAAVIRSTGGTTPATATYIRLGPLTGYLECNLGQTTVPDFPKPASLCAARIETLGRLDPGVYRAELITYYGPILTGPTNGTAAFITITP